MKTGDEAFERLRRAIEELAELDAAELVTEARIEARARVRSILSDAMAHALLERAHGELAPSAAAQRPETLRAPAPDRPAPPADGGLRIPPTPDPGHPPAPHRVRPAPHREQPARALDDQPVRRGEQRPSGGPVDLGWYVYGVVGAEEIDLGSYPPGVDAANPLAMVRHDGLGALVSRVPLNEFGEESLRESLDDLGWLEDKARAHERVLDHTRKLTTVIPMRLCTIYTSEASVRDMLTRERHWLSEALVRLGGRTEWGVKLFAGRNAHELAGRRSPEAARLEEQVARASPGEAYLLRKKLHEIGAQEAERLVEECCEAGHRHLAGTAVDALLNPLQPREVTGRDGDMVLNGVYLVEDDSTEDFHAAVASLEEEYGQMGIDVELTGPWPPYNFVKGSIESAR